jgi:hypothetical protein
MQRFYQSILDLTDASSKVVAWPPLHPVVRHDVFYGWNRTTDPAGYTTESIVRDMGLPQYILKFEEQDYWRQLESHPPALIVSSAPLTASYEPAQARVLEKFLHKHQTEYILVDDGLLCSVWLRRTEALSALPKSPPPSKSLRAAEPDG